MLIEKIKECIDNGNDPINDVMIAMYGAIYGVGNQYQYLNLDFCPYANACKNCILYKSIPEGWGQICHMYLI